MGKKKQADHNADTRGGQWIGLPRCVKRSHSYATLSFSARAVLIEILDQFNGFNNGKIVISQAQLMIGLGTTSQHTVKNAVAELMEHGLIDVPFEGEWKQRKAREFRITFINTTRANAHVRATNDYLDFNGVKRRDKKKNQLAMPK